MAAPFQKEFRLSHSSRTIGCDRKFYFRKFFPGGDQNRELAPECGKALHTGYQNWLINKNREAAIAAMMLEYPIDLNTNCMDVRSLEACYATLNNMLDANHLQQYDVATIICLDGVERPAIEVPFKITLRNEFLDEEETIPIVYIGYIDAILFDRLKTNYLTADVKTHRDNTFDLSPKFKFSTQCIPYGFTLEHMLGHQLQQFDINYIAAFLDILEPKTELYTFTKTREDIEEWMLDVAIDIQKYKTAYRINHWKRNGENCNSFYKKCSHFDYCEVRNIETLSTMRYGVPDVKPEVQPVDNFEPWVEFTLSANLELTTC